MLACSISVGFIGLLISSFFMVALDIVPLAIPSLPILSCANAGKADAAPSEMMTAEARSKTREALFMVLSFQKPVSNDICRQTEYTMKVDHVTSVRYRHCKPIALASGQLLPDLGLDSSRNGSSFLRALGILDHSLYISTSQVSRNRTLL